ncbi:alpha-keto acid decarboxylase family protein [Beijerinckia mobilis]|uniref:alpha-keto acid decarboxylase family protein n=1 Tax=Beijerinckia mobilis TaxID=231434 RepID=UPI00055482BB|nr:thiamine pyrophosphate-binding protein [Beijerinckia mobilis]
MASVIQYVLERLKAIGISDVFGVPGDYSFPVNDAICNDPDLQWIGCCNELNAAYAADGYARLKGAAALCTTYGVGELSALNGIAGSYAEHLPVFHLVGTPSMAVQSARAPVHHTLGNGEYDLFRRMTEPVVCAYAVMTPQNVAFETERLIAEALYHRRPVYMAFPANLADQPVLSAAAPITLPHSDPQTLAQATDAILTALAETDTACILPGNLIHRCGLQTVMQSIINHSGLPFATMFMDKSVLDEHHPSFAGMYDGALLNEDVRQFVENAGRILSIGTLMSDLNSGAFTARLDPERTITIAHHAVSMNGKTYANVEIGDVLQALSERIKHRDWPCMKAHALGEAKGADKDPIDVDALYPRWQIFLQPEDIVVVETGTASMGLAFALMPKGANFYNQTLWGSIGWATPAALGAAVAAPQRRLVLITGEGSHQMTAQEISLFGRLGLKPIIFVLNNDGYLIERLLCKDPEIAYNDIAQWRYSELPHALGCNDWFTAKVTTCGEFDAALAKAAQTDTGVYIEVVTDKYTASPLARKLHENMKSLYKA